MKVLDRRFFPTGGGGGGGTGTDPNAVPLTQKGTANGVATLDSGGMVPASQLPSLAVVDYLGAVGSQAAMLALTGGEKGDWCARTDLGTVWIISGANSAQIGSWTQLSYPSGQDATASVKGGVALAGDLAGAGSTAAAPVITAKAITAAKIADLAITNAQVATGAAITPSKIAGTALTVSNNLSEVTAATARTNLGLGTAAVANTGTGASNVVLGNDARLTDARTPAAHAASHASGGSDAITVAQTQVTGLATALSGKADLVGGVLNVAQLPPIAVVDFLGAVGSQAAMLALVGQKGDWCARTDLGTVWVVSGADSSQLGSWTQLTYPSSQDAGPSVKGQIALAGDLAGAGSTAAAPIISANAITTVKIIDGAVTASKIVDGSITNTQIAGSAAIAQSKVATLVADLAAKVVKSELVYNVKDFGAKGDNAVTNTWQVETAAINTAISTASAAGGGTVVIPPGIYVVYGIVLLDNVTVRGEGGWLKIPDNLYTNASGSYYAIRANARTNVALINLKIDGNGAKNTVFGVGDAITVSGENILVDGCTVLNPPDSGIMFTAVTNSALVNCRVDNPTDLCFYINDGVSGTVFHENVIANNRLTGGPNGGIALKRLLTRALIVGNTIYNCGWGISLEHGTGTDWSTNVSIIGNRLRHIGYIGTGTGRGLELRGCDYVVCTGNRLEDIKDYGIALTSARYSVIANNVIDMTPGSSTAARSGIWVADRGTPFAYSSSRNVISGNVIKDTTGAGIHVTGATTNIAANNIVTGNQVINAGTYGLQVDANVNGLNVTGNILEGVSGDVSVSTSAAGVSAVGNRLITGVISGSFVQSGTVPVWEYGAVGDGVKDDTVAFQAALNAAATGSTVVLASGKTYLLGQVDVADKTDVVIDGRGARIVWKATGSRIGLRLTGTCTNVTIQNLVIIGNSSTVDSHAGIYNLSTAVLKNIKVRNCRIYNCTQGIAFAVASPGTLIGLLVEGNHIEGAAGTATGYGYGIYVSIGDDGGHHSVRIVNNMLIAAQRHAIYHAAGAGSVISGNTILNHRTGVADGSLYSAIMIVKSADITVTGNTCADGYDSALTIGGVAAGAYARNITVTGNVFTSPKDTVALVVIGQQAPATDLYPDGVVFAGNTLYSTLASTLIQLYSGKRVRIVANMLTVTATTGTASAIRLVGQSETAGTALYTDDVVVSENTFSLATGGTKYPINMSGLETAAARLAFTGNRYTVPGNAFYAPVSITNPNLTAIGQDISGLVFASGVALSNGASLDVQKFPAGGTWTKPAWATTTDVVAIGGGGGGSGACNAAGAIRVGGAGAGGGGVSSRLFNTADLTATVAVTVGAAGTGGAAAASGNGAPGTSGTSTTFGAFLVARGGSLGGGGGVAAGGAATGGVGGGGMQLGATGGSNTNAGIAGVGGGATSAGAGGGGSGGGVTAANAESVGGAGVGAAAANLAAGTAGAVAGGAGGAGASAPTGVAIVGQGGGGGGSSASTSVNGGAGGAGGTYGGGGGGGGAGTSGGTATSGAGGAGAAGICVAISR